MNKSDDSFYTLQNAPLDEAIFGKNLISLGGTDAIDNMFSDINISDLKLLDVGFGLGGVAFYLAATRHVPVFGVEINDWMVEYARTHAPKNIAALLKFSVYDKLNNLPYENDFFDLVYSKGVFNHIKIKDHLFSEISRVLRSGGQLVIADWIHLDYEINDDSPLVKETRETYENILTISGFYNIMFRDDSHLFVTYVNILLNNLSEKKSFIEESFGKEIFDIILNDYQQLIKDIQHKNKFAVRITAQKS